jgi:hypothetical protein
MYLYVELWKAKDAWLRLSTAERKARIEQIGREAQANPLPGVVPFSFRQTGNVIALDGSITQPVVVDDAAARPTGFRYVAAWMIPTRELIVEFEKRVEKLGWWFDCFEQKNAWGEMDAQATIADLIGLRQRVASNSAAPGLGRFGRTEHAVSKLRDDMDELMRGVNVIAEYIRAEQNKGRN